MSVLFDDIAVLAAKREDGQLVHELLSEAGYQVARFDALPSLSNPP